MWAGTPGGVAHAGVYLPVGVGRVDSQEQLTQNTRAQLLGTGGYGMNHDELARQTNTRQRIEHWLEVLVIIAALATIPVTYIQARGDTSLELRIADWTIWAIFTMEYVVLLLFASNRRAYVRREWLVLMIIVVSFPLLPNLLALARMLRLVRVVRLLRLLRLAGVTARGLSALQRVFGRRGVLFMGVASIILVLAGGAAMTLLEPEATDQDIGTGLWWAIVTATTVGYGDVAPQTIAGRVVGVILMLLGIGIVGTLAASIAAYFVSTDEDDAEVTRLREQVARLEDINDRLDQIDERQQRIELMLNDQHRQRSLDD
jgi:voltage-gated potassium channel